MTKEKITQQSVDRAMRITLVSSKECGSNITGLGFREWNFDTTVLYGDHTTIKIPLCFDEMTARYELAQYLVKNP